MNQPKFKFGDLVKDTSRDGRPFKIGLISFACKGFFYSENRDAQDSWRAGVAEFNLELYQEPKKLYMGLFKEDDLGVYRIPDCLFESESIAKKYASECSRTTFIKFIQEIDINSPGIKHATQL